jgi:hypothetical protein
MDTLLLTRRGLLGTLAAGAAGYAAVRMDYLKSRLAVARTSHDSRWYPYTDKLAERLSDMSLSGWAGLSQDALNNRHLLDLRETASIAGFAVGAGKRLIGRTESWELSAENPESKNDVGYPSLVISRTADGRPQYNLFYAIHDVSSGIGLAQAPRLEGPYRKHGESNPFPDSRVLYPPARPRLTSHLSSPVVIWNEELHRWHMYFHYYSNQFDEGFGHQNTALAVSQDLENWDILLGSDGDFLAVLPVTRELWMNSQSTYHSIQRLPNGLWLAFLRGTGVRFVDGKQVPEPTAMSFAVSPDGIRWSLVPGAPQFPALPPVAGKNVIRRPGFVARLRDDYLICWSEGVEVPGQEQHRLAYTRDFVRFRPADDILHFPVSDGAITPWRRGSDVFLVSGPWLYPLQRAKVA